MKECGEFQLRAGLYPWNQRWIALFSAVVVLTATASSALAQEMAQISPQGASVARSSQDQLQTPSRQPRKPFRAARLTFLTGDVAVEQASVHGNDRNQEAAVLNMPIVEGAVVSTGEDGQAEIEFEDGSLVRLTPNSGLSLLKLSVDGSGHFVTRAAVTGGLVYLELRAGTKYLYSVDAGGDVITPVENSTLRVSLDEPPAVIAVLDGLAHIAAVSGSPDVDAAASQTIRMTSASEGGTYLVTQEIAPESWDQWNEERDQSAASEASTQTAARDQYAGNQGYGWSDLDANGSWYDVPGQGEVWQPNEAEDSADDSGPGSGTDGFDPYGYGNWVYTLAGYSWASGYGWGWLPYRCGQWGWWSGFGWGWQPGFGCGVYGFGGFGYGGINVHHPPGFWHRPHRPLPGPSPFHPIVKVGTAPTLSGSAFTAGGRPFGNSRVLSVKSINGRTVEPLSPVGEFPARPGFVIGSGLRRDYPVDESTREPAFGVVATHSAAPAPAPGRMPWPAAGSSVSTPRSHMVPAYPYSGYSPQRPASAGASRPAPVSRPAPAAARPSPPPAASHPSSSPSPRK